VVIPLRPPRNGDLTLASTAGEHMTRLSRVNDDRALAACVILADWILPPSVAA